MSQYKNIDQVLNASSTHMVGDGFKVRPYIHSSIWEEVSPFLMLDYVAPWPLTPTDVPRGVDVHPHKGFETVTILWEGALAHEDSSGGKGVIHAGDVQWMTAGSGILHKEFHEKEFSKQGGRLHCAQLWVNLPAQYKSEKPAYQDIYAKDIPSVKLDEGEGYVRVIAGSLKEEKGPARTFTRIQIFDVHASAGGKTTLPLVEGDTAALLILQGTALVRDKVVRAGDMIIFEKSGSLIDLEANNELHALLLSGEPIDEPIAAYGPFVMNTKEEIQLAIVDYHAGKFGVLH
ncbi:MAG: pirin family protein [Bacteroidota bacterium]